MMYEDQYNLSKLEKADLQRCFDVIDTYGGLFKFNRTTGQPIVDSAGNAIPSPFERLAGSPTLLARFCVDSDKVVWPFMSRGAVKCPHLPDGGGSRAQSDYVEMANGRWRKIKDPYNPGQMTYAKNTVYVNVESQVQGHPNMSKIEYMKSRKGFRHPLAEPNYPPAQELSSLESKQRANAPVILAQVKSELAKAGLDKAGDYVAQAEARAAEVTTPVAPLPEQTRRPDPIVMQSPPTQTTSDTLSTAHVPDGPPVVEPVAPPAPEPATPAATDAKVATVDVRATQDAIECAASNGIDLATVKGSGMNGRIKIGDVKALVPVPAGRTNRT